MGEGKKLFAITKYEREIEREGQNHRRDSRTENNLGEISIRKMRYIFILLTCAAIDHK